MPPQTEESFAGAPNNTRFAIRSANTVRGCALCAGSYRWLQPAPSCRSSTAHAPPSFRLRASATSDSRSRQGSAQHAWPPCPSSGHCEGFELLGKMLATTLLGRGHMVDLTVIATAPSLDAHAHTLLFEDIQVLRLHRLDIVLADAKGPGRSPLSLQNRGCLPHLLDGSRGIYLKSARTPRHASPSSSNLPNVSPRCQCRSSFTKFQPPVPTGNRLKAILCYSNFGSKHRNADL
jgi:hypothetical protein